MQENQTSKENNSLLNSKNVLINSLENMVKSLIEKTDSGTLFKLIFDFIFKALSYLFLVFGIISCIINIFGDDGYFANFDYYDLGEKTLAIVGFLIGLTTCLLVLYIIFTIIKKRSDQLESSSYDGILSYIYKVSAPVIISIFGEVFSVITLTVGVLFIVANLINSTVYFPLSDIANFMSQVFDMGINENTQIYLSGSWDYFTEGIKMSFGIVALSPVVFICTYIFKTVYQYVIELIIKLIEFSITKNGVLILFIALVLSYIVIGGFFSEIIEEIF